MDARFTKRAATSGPSVASVGVCNRQMCGPLRLAQWARCRDHAWPQCGCPCSHPSPSAALMWPKRGSPPSCYARCGSNVALVGRPDSRHGNFCWPGRPPFRRFQQFFFIQTVEKRRIDTEPQSLRRKNNRNWVALVSMSVCLYVCLYICIFFK